MVTRREYLTAQLEVLELRKVAVHDGGVWGPDEIRRAREARGWTQQRLADEAQVSKRTVGSWESGESNPQSRNGMLDEIFGSPGGKRSTSSAPATPATPATLSDAELIAQIGVLIAEVARRFGNDRGRARSEQPPAHADEVPDAVYVEDEPSGVSAETG